MSNNLLKGRKHTLVKGKTTEARTAGQGPGKIDPQAVINIQFTVEEMDALMSALIEANVPVRIWLLLDSKFGPYKAQLQRSITPSQLVQKKVTEEDGDNGPGEAHSGDK